IHPPLYKKETIRVKISPKRLFFYSVRHRGKPRPLSPAAEYGPEDGRTKREHLFARFPLPFPCVSAASGAIGSAAA
ncbi:hypothetical protein, partial [Neglectibacter timonensis]|uniref:hypothetical protein n=1 Tax=Neglectibacter timonensis TaxID=1776382 RepID=UPI003AB71819